MPDTANQPAAPKPGDENFVGGVAAYIHPSDANAAADFYERAFGAKVIAKMQADDGKRLIHCHLLINGGPLLMSDSFPEHGFPVQTPQAFQLHLQVDDPLGWWERAVSAGCAVVFPIKQEFWGEHFWLLKDPFGISWTIGGMARA